MTFTRFTSSQLSIGNDGIRQKFNTSIEGLIHNSIAENKAMELRLLSFTMVNAHYSENSPNCAP
jgi:hypothetical protein